jgi:hypothetical protein
MRSSVVSALEACTAYDASIPTVAISAIDPSVVAIAENTDAI